MVKHFDPSCPKCNQKFHVHHEDLRYAGVTEYAGTPGKLSNDSAAGLAQAKCQAGDTEAGIRILERKLRDAKLDPPPRS